MKVLQVLCGGAWGGGSVIVLANTQGLITRGDRVWVISTDDETTRRFQEAGATVVRLRFWFRPINPYDLISFLQLFLLCLREKFDLVDTHTSKGGFLGRFAARLAGVPHILHHAHGWSFNGASRLAVRQFYIALERLAARTGDLIIAVSEDQRQIGIQTGVEAPERILAVFNGIDLHPFAEADRRSARRLLGFPENRLLIGSVGRLQGKKGFEYLIRALPAVRASFPSTHLAIFGEGPMEAELRQQAARLGVERQVSFFGFRRDVPKLLAAFDVMVQPSEREGLSIALIEAAAAGKAIVTCSIPGNFEIIEHGKTGLLVPPADSVALAEAIQTILSNPTLAEELGKNARRSAQLRFSKERMVEETLAIYDELLALKRGNLVLKQTRETAPPLGSGERS